MIDSTEDLEIVYYKKSNLRIIIPDGGYGWWTVFAAFMNSALIDGMFFSFGFIRPLLMEYLPPMESASFAINWIGALQVSFPLLCGPIASMLGKKFGFRVVAMIGGFISCCSYIICFLSPPNIWIFYIFYGIINGMGLGMVFMAGLITISQYFDKKRPLSTGTAVCGTGFGIFVMGSLMQAIVSYFSWHGTIFILAGMSLQTIVFCCLLRPLDPISVDSNSCQEENLKPELYQIQNSMIFSKEAIDSVIKSGFVSSFINLTSMKEAMGVPPIEKEDIMYIRSLMNVTGVPIQHRESLDETIGPVGKRLHIFQYFCCRPVCFRNSQLFLYYLSALLFSCCYTLPFYYVASTVTEKYSFNQMYAGFIVSTMGVSSSVFRFGTGVLATLAPDRKIWIYIIALLMAGTMNIISTFLGTYLLWIFWAIIVGGTLGSVITLESVILAEMVTLDEMASAFGLYQMICGIGFLIGPPFAGLIFDIFQNYDMIFWVSGTLFIISALVVVPIQWISGTR
uniref:Slc16a-17 n=1 Tax=Schmidtea mediterranea TaxID=79327 RepID=A0A0H3YFA0_SCHMD|nr:slc16a-17 [Schmidtea mediterranea]